MNKLNRYLTIQEWMLELDLKTSELMAFALIYGFSQDGKSAYKGSSEYISYWLKLSNKATLTILRKLVKKGYVVREDKKVGCVTYADYLVSTKFVYAGSKFRRTKEVSSPHNNTHNKKDNNGVKSIFDR